MNRKIVILSLAVLLVLPMVSIANGMVHHNNMSTKQQWTTYYIIEPDTESELRLPLGYYADKLNPVSSTTAYDWEILGLLFDGFTTAHPFKYFDIHADMPWMLAEEPEWKVVYDAKLGYNISYWIFKLRDDIYFSDGIQMTADDLIFTYEFVKWAEPEWAVELNRMFINASKVDDFTVKVFLNTTGFISARYAMVIVYPKHIYERATTWGGTRGTFPDWDVTPTMVKEYRAKSPDDEILTGYGPFKLTHWYPEDKPCTEATIFELERNPHYFMRAVDEAGNVIWDWHELTPEYVDQYGVDALRGPYIKRITYRVIIETADIVGALLAEQIDMAADFAFGRYYNELVGADLTLAYAPRLGFGHTFFNVRNWPLNESAFRRALAYAYDKRAVCQKVWAGWAEPLDVPVPKSMGEWSIEYMTLKPDSYADHNAPKALEELETIGIKDTDGDGWLEGPDGSEITITIEGTDTADVRAIVETLAASVESVGIHVERKYVDFRTLVTHLVYGQFEILFFGYGLGRLPTFLEGFASWSVLSEFGGWSNPIYDQIIREAFYEESDLDKVKELVWEAQLILFYELPIVPIYQNVIVGAYKSVERFGTDGWAGVFEQLVGAPIVNGYTIMKAVKPKSVTTTSSMIPVAPQNITAEYTTTETEVSTEVVPTTAVQIVTSEASQWIGIGIAINIIILAVASALVIRRPE